MLSAKLVVVGGDVKTTEIKLRLPAVIGRGKGSTITLLQPLVSRQHCELFEANGKLWVRDLGSLNGTYVNNEKVTESELPPNDLLTVGTVTFRAVYEVTDDANNTVQNVPQFLPSKARTAEDEQPTIRVDSPLSSTPAEVSEELPVEVSADEVEKLLDDDEAGIPSTPLFGDATVPAPTKPAAMPRAIVPQKPAPTAPASPTRPSTPGARPTTFIPPPDPAPAATNGEAAAEEPAEVDEDLNDFLKSLGGK
jgi:pSer/pThr/pTyr-binding forkhead associated (FHA) protein